MKQTISTGLISFLLAKLWIPLIILVILLLLYLYFAGKRKSNKNLFDMSNKTDLEKRIHYSTMEIINGLGVGFTHPLVGENWRITEDEESVVNVLLDNQTLFNQINEHYSSILNNSLIGSYDLVEDLKKYLSNQQIKEVEFLWI